MPKYKKWRGRGGRREFIKNPIARWLARHPLIRDFLLGAFGKILGLVLAGVGVFLLIDGLIFGAVGKIIGGVLCLGFSFGARYALGDIIRLRRR